MRTAWIIFLFAVLMSSRINAQEQKAISPKELKSQIQVWETKIRAELASDGKRKAIAAKYPLIVLHSVHLNQEFEPAYSFVTKKKHRFTHEMNVYFQESEGKPFLHSVGPNNLAVRLGKIDFETNIDPKAIGINHPGIVTRRAGIPAATNEVILLRVRDRQGSDFYGVLKILAVDSEARYVAFIWRMLPGGRMVAKPLDE